MFGLQQLTENQHFPLKNFKKYFDFWIFTIFICFSGKSGAKITILKVSRRTDAPLEVIVFLVENSNF
jgi:hypothetical protein